MSDYIKDRTFSDKIWESELAKNTIKSSGLFKNPVKYDESTNEKDMNNSIDGYINGCPVQYRFQNKLNIKGRLSNYHPTIRYKRDNSKAEKQKLSEWFKIKKNREQGNEYPKYLIWGVVNEQDQVFEKFIIINIDILYENYNNKEYRIIPDDENDLPDGDPNSFEPDFTVINKIDNNDGSSSFLVLDDDYITEYTH